MLQVQQKKLKLSGILFDENYVQHGKLSNIGFLFMWNWDHWGKFIINELLSFGKYVIWTIEGMQMVKGLFSKSFRVLFLK